MQLYSFPILHSPLRCLTRPLCLRLAVVAALLCFNACSTDDLALQPQTEQGRALSTLLQSLDWGADTCYVFGHKTPDVDAVASSLAYARLMRRMGYNCKAKVCSPTNRETAIIARAFGFRLPELKTSVEPQTRLILTDHTDYVQCVDGSREAVILQKIDHHAEGDIKDSGIPFVRREMLGSTNTIVYEMYNELGIAIDDEAARIMLAGIISDTRNLSTSSTTAIDSTAMAALTAQLGISADSVARLNRVMEEAAYDYTGMTDTDIFLSDYKEYDIAGRRLGFGCLACKQGAMTPFIDRMLTVMPQLMQQNRLQMVVAMINNQVENTGPDHDKRPYVDDGLYFLYCGEGAKEVAEALFGTSLREGVCFTTKGISRKQIVTLINEMLK